MYAVGTTLNPNEAALLGRILESVNPAKLSESGINTKQLIGGTSDKLLEELQFLLCRIPDVHQFADNLHQNLKSRKFEQ